MASVASVQLIPKGDWSHAPFHYLITTDFAYQFEFDNGDDLGRTIEPCVMCAIPTRAMDALLSSPRMCIPCSQAAASSTKWEPFNLFTPLTADGFAADLASYLDPLTAVVVSVRLEELVQELKTLPLPQRRRGLTSRLEEFLFSRRLRAYRGRELA